MSGPVLAVRLRVPLDRFAVEVDLTLGARVTGLFGPSGAGKSSLVEAIAGLRRGARGRVSLGDEVWQDDAAGRRLPPEARRVGWVPQDALLFPHLDVRGNLRAGLRGDGRALDAFVEALEIGPLLGRAVDTLSGGERQRVALARALCAGPRLLVLDEPFSGLDLPLQRRILPFLSRIPHRFELPMLLVSHDPVAIQALCDEVVVLREGRVLAQGNPREVLSDPAIFPLAAEAGFRNVLPCRVESAAADTCAVRLGSDGSGPRLLALASGAEPAGATCVTIPATDVLVAVERPRGISARNVLAARVAAVTAAGELRLVHARVADGVPPIVAEVTRGACDELGLVPGRECHLIVKTAACQVW